MKRKLYVIVGAWANPSDQDTDCGGYILNGTIYKSEGEAILALKDFCKDENTDEIAGQDEKWICRDTNTWEKYSEIDGGTIDCLQIVEVGLYE